MKSILPISLLFFLAACGETPPCERDVEAFVMSQTFIERKLRSPSTAEHPSITDAGVSVRAIPKGEGCSFVVMTHVDAQNAFGGTIRENFMVELEPDGGRSWKLIGINAY
ncbi:MAG: hypothetical protein ABJP34_11285 [Erythrobacter sp.]